MDSSKLARALVKGLRTKHRPATARIREAYKVLDPSGRIVAEALVNRTHVRLQFRDPLPRSASTGHSGVLRESSAPGRGDKSWPGGAVAMTEENQVAARTLLEAAVATKSATKARGRAAA